MERSLRERRIEPLQHVRPVAFEAKQIRTIASLALLTAIATGGCASVEPPTAATIATLNHLKAAQVADVLLDTDVGTKLQQEIGAGRIQSSAAPGYARSVLGRLPGFKRVGRWGPADIIVERWDAPYGVATQVTFRPKTAVPARDVWGSFKDYVFYDDGREVIVDYFFVGPPPQVGYESPEDFSSGFYCSSPDIERKVLVGRDLFGRPLEYRMMSRRMPGFDGGVPVLAGMVLVQPGAAWELAPETPPVEYPERAVRMERNGRVRLKCLVSESGKLSECETLDEAFQGMGFATAALKWSAQAQLLTRDPASAAGSKPIEIDMTFSLRNREAKCPALAGAEREAR